MINEIKFKHSFYISIPLLFIFTSMTLCGCSQTSAVKDEAATSDTPVIVIEEKADNQNNSQTESSLKSSESSSDLQDPEADTSNNAEEIKPQLFEGDFSGVIADGVKSGVIYSFEDKHIESASDEGVVYFSSDYQIPSIEIKDNVPASAAINDYLQQGVDSFVSNLDIMSAEAQVFFETEYLTDAEDPAEIACDPFIQNSSFDPARLDTTIVSLRESAQGYSGGTHANDVTSGYNFDAKSGNLITLSTIAKDTTALKASAREYITVCRSSLPEDVYPEYSNIDSSIDSMFSDGNWYMTGNGIVFIAGEGLLAPIPAGILEFEVPYSSLEGFNEAYLPVQ